MPNARDCYKCGASFSIFRWRHNCEQCRRTFCSDCITYFDEYGYFMFKNPTDDYENSYLCSACWEKKISAFDKKYNESFKKLDSIQCYPETYKGKIFVDSKADEILIESDYNEDWEDSIDELKVTALVLGYNVIYKVRKIKEVESRSSDNGKGTYYYSVWKAIGIATRKG